MVLLVFCCHLAPPSSITGALCVAYKNRRQSPESKTYMSINMCTEGLEGKAEVKILLVWLFYMVKLGCNSNYFNYLPISEHLEVSPFQVLTLKHELPKTTLTRSHFP